VFLRKAANLFNFPGLDGAAGGGNTAAAGGAGTTGGRGCGGNIIGRGRGVAGFKVGSNLYLYSSNFLELIKSKYCFKSSKESPCSLN
jgi:hypothetical protein